MASIRMTKLTRLVLGVFLADPDAERYGYEVCKEVDYKSGAVYPLLYKFERLGWLKSRRESINPTRENRPPRRYYQLTSEGIELAREALKRPIKIKAAPRTRGTTTAAGRR